MILTVKRWLETGKIDIFLGYRLVEGHPLPFAFGKDDLAELDGLIISEVRYPLEKIATQLAAEQPEIKIGILARDCSQRALNVLYIWNQLSPENIQTFNVNCCPSDLKKKPDCSYLKPEKSGVFKKQVGIDNNLSTSEAEAFDQGQRISRWMYEFQKCIKCYGCRNICPVCFCTECSLEHKDLIATGSLPPDVPVFHLVRAVHMAGRCVDCGLCEEACPVDIPLRLLYRKVNEIISNVFDYQTGVSEQLSPFSMLGDRVTLKTISIEAA
jgi:formate dehydrogenase subunit beta